MRSILIANTVITNKTQAKRLIETLNRYFPKNKSIEMALVIDDYAERLVTAGFLTWEEVEKIA